MPATPSPLLTSSLSVVACGLLALVGCTTKQAGPYDAGPPPDAGPPLPMGACCMGGGGCFVTQPPGCFGTYHDGETCDDVVCPGADAGPADAGPGGSFDAGGGADAGTACDGPSTCLLTPGVYPVPTGYSAPEGMFRILGGWAMTNASQLPIGFGGGGGVFIVDLITRSTLYESSSRDTFGMIGFRAPPDALFKIGPFSSFSVWDPALRDFGFTLVSRPGSGPYTDATTIGGGPTADGWVEVDNGRNVVAVSRWDASTSSFSDGTAVAGSAITTVTSNRAVSAYAHQRTGPALIVTDGAPGDLLVHDLSGTRVPPVLIGAVGTGSRRLRCLPPVCAVSNFLSSNLTTIAWDGTSTTPTLVGTQDVGDGPVGIDLAMDGSMIVVASTGFNDDTITLTRVASDASVDSSTPMPAPAGCSNPGHVIWVRDVAGLKLLVSCNGSDAYAIVDPML